MSTSKPTPTKQDPMSLIESIQDPKRKADCIELMSMMSTITDCAPVMWGEDIIAYGQYNYIQLNGEVNEWFRVGFTPRENDIKIYLMSGPEKYENLLSKMGKHTTSVSCVYIKGFKKLNIKILNKVLQRSVEDMDDFLYKNKK